VDAAVLDVNVGGDLVYPLADILVAENIPFVFVTGYGADELESRFLTVPILQKPIELNALQTIFARPSSHADKPQAISRGSAVG
jgi:hypothetical protein